MKAFPPSGTLDTVPTVSGRLQAKHSRCRLPRLQWLLLTLTLFSPAISWARTPIPPQGDCETPLIAAIHKRDSTEVIKILKSGTDLNARDCNGATGLNEAIVYSEAEFVEKLVLSGAGVNVTDSGGWSPLMTASWYCRRQIVPFLLEHGAEVNAVDAEGYSALMHSVQNCPDGTTAALLLRWGAKINAQATKYQDTALTVAAFYGNEHAVHVLVAAGADLNAKTYRRETALTIARDRDVGRKESHDRIYHFLVEASAADKARSSRHN